MTSEATDYLNKAISFLKQDDIGLSLTAKIDYLEKKGLSSKDILESIKSAIEIGLINYRNGNNPPKYHAIWNKAAPWLSIAAVGLATFYLTGEDSNNLRNEDDIQQLSGEEINIINQVTQSKVNTDDTASSSSSSSSSKDESTEPEWAKKVLESFLELSEDVKRLNNSYNEILLSGGGHHRNSHGGNNHGLIIPIISLPDRLNRLAHIITIIQNLYTSSSPSSSTIAVANPMNMSSFADGNGTGLCIFSEDGKTACTSLIMYFKTALENPTVPRYRRIAIENQRLKSSLNLLLVTPFSPNNTILSPHYHQQQHHHHHQSQIQQFPLNAMSSSSSSSSWSVCDELMACVGFIRKGMYYEWQWMNDANKNSNNTTTTNSHTSNHQQQQNDSPELTSTPTNNAITSQQPQYRFSAGYTARMNATNTIATTTNSNTLTPSQGAAAAAAVGATSVVIAENSSNTAEAVPDDETAATVVRECILLLSNLKNYGNSSYNQPTLMTSHMYGYNNNYHHSHNNNYNNSSISGYPSVHQQQQQQQQQQQYLPLQPLHQQQQHYQPGIGYSLPSLPSTNTQYPLHHHHQHQQQQQQQQQQIAPAMLPSNYATTTMMTMNNGTIPSTSGLPTNYSTYSSSSSSSSSPSLSTLLPQQQPHYQLQHTELQQQQQQYYQLQREELQQQQQQQQQQLQQQPPGVYQSPMTLNAMTASAANTSILHPVVINLPSALSQSDSSAVQSQQVNNSTMTANAVNEAEEQINHDIISSSHTTVIPVNSTSIATSPLTTVTAPLTTMTVANTLTTVTAPLTTTTPSKSMAVGPIKFSEIMSRAQSNRKGTSSVSSQANTVAMSGGESEITPSSSSSSQITATSSINEDNALKVSPTNDDAGDLVMT